MKILVMNAGSSSLKWKLFEMETNHAIASGLIEGISEYYGSFHFDFQEKVTKVDQHIADHNSAFTLLFETLSNEKIVDLDNDLSAIGHRVVHGGESFTAPILIDKQVLKKLKTLTHLAPLHNPANILGIETCLQLANHVPHIAVFDTAFHHSLPEHAYLYALPSELYTKHHIRRYGFHGTSHHFIAQAAAKLQERPLDQLNLITLHLGNGASACAVQNGKSIDTSMGFTPLEGLVMGTRSGDIDPAIIIYLQQQGFSIEEIDTLLNRESGLKGICHENDLRTIIQRASNRDRKAQLALEIFTYRIKKYIGAYIAVLGRVDGIVFTGGIGEHAPLIRSMVLQGLDQAFGIVLDEQLNQQNQNVVHQEQSRIKVYVIATNEELQIARECSTLIKKL